MKQICKKCKENKDVKARGLCNACYKQEEKNKNLDKYPRIRLSNKEMRVCKKCKKIKKIYSAGYCYNCYVTERIISRCISGQRVRTNVPIASRKEAEEFFEKKKKEILEDIQNNPRKWLEKK